MQGFTVFEDPFDGTYLIPQEFDVKSKDILERTDVKYSSPLAYTMSKTSFLDLVPFFKETEVDGEKTLNAFLLIRYRSMDLSQKMYDAFSVLGGGRMRPKDPVHISNAKIKIDSEMRSWQEAEKLMSGQWSYAEDEQVVHNVSCAILILDVDDLKTFSKFAGASQVIARLSANNNWSKDINLLDLPEEKLSKLRNAMKNYVLYVQNNYGINLIDN